MMTLLKIDQNLLRININAAVEGFVMGHTVADLIAEVRALRSPDYDELINKLGMMPMPRHGKHDIGLSNGMQFAVFTTGLQVRRSPLAPSS